MSRLVRSILVGVLQLVLLVGVWARFRYDQSHLPRSWVKVQMVDPDALLRGRYLVLRTVDTSPSLQFEMFVPEHLNVPGQLSPDGELWAEIGRSPGHPHPLQLVIRRHGATQVLVGQ